jgi:hypothetical protein
MKPLFTEGQVLCRALKLLFVLRWRVIELGPFQERLEKHEAETCRIMSKPAGEMCRRKERIFEFEN